MALLSQQLFSFFWFYSQLGWGFCVIANLVKTIHDGSFLTGTFFIFWFYGQLGQCDNVTEEEKQAYKQKENQRQSWLRRVEIAKMSDKERSNFHAKKMVQVTASRKEKKKKPQLHVKIPAKNPYKSRQSFGKAWIDAEQNFPTLPRNVLQ